MPAWKTLELDVEDGVATLRLNRPEALNAIDHTMADELGEVLERLRHDTAVRAVVLTGAGGAFCAGGDVRGTAGAGPRTALQLHQGMERFHRMVLALHRLPQPAIAAVDGVAFGAGFSLLLLCDLVLLSERARLCMAFQRIGLVPDCGALYTLPRAVGMQRARELVLSGREIGAQEARDIGLALEVLPAAMLQARARELARSLCGASAQALAFAKQALDLAWGADLGAVLAQEAALQAIVLGTPYVAEAGRRFVAKEPPLFRWPRG